ncbi:RNA-binding region-containing protein 3-like isoform X2 [Corticium candelabrum]|uniref:RNA-binding region-containing protein 3-like isoform X2 n=1 Tax=Corticium candelabrum TaxID=121492 RepID=UPI002E270DE4|nr:RNA-binding region-containing protein 3-like isoform X2 [Corticium candelabrum]
MENSSRTLLVRHLPTSLSFEEKEDFLRHFGAVEVTVMETRGRMRNCAFATFGTNSTAEKAMSRLHQLKILGSQLVIEFANAGHIKLQTQEQAKHGWNYKNKHDKDKVSLQADNESCNSQCTLPLTDALAPQHGLTYPRTRSLRYAYPPPTIDTLVNISHALACVTGFYEQVLHLMNKMNLPPPFGPATLLPPNLANSEPSLQLSPPVSPARKYDVESDESEMETDEEFKSQPVPSIVIPNTKHRKRRPVPAVFTLTDKQPPQIKRRKLSVGTDKVFERPTETRKASLHLLIGATLEYAQKLDQNPEQTPDEIAGTVGFGKIVPPPCISKEQTADEDKHFGGGVVTEIELKENRLSENELKMHSAFKNYSPGQPASRLYVKNLSRKTTERDLSRVFGRYINQHSDEDMLWFNIQVMTEGRMKGQAFVGLPSEAVATRALTETNGFMIHGRPMCVQFARSAKAKQKDSQSAKGQRSD